LQIGDGHNPIPDWINLLSGTLSVPRDARAQRLVPRQHLRQRPRQRCGIEPAVQPHRGSNVVGGGRGLELAEEPEAPLRGRERHHLIPFSPNDRRHGVDRVGGSSRVNRRGEAGDRRRLEQASQRHLHSEHLLDASDHPRRQQRVSSEIEEAILDADAVDAKDVGPDAAQQFLERGPRRNIRVASSRTLRGRRRQCPAIELSTRRARQRGQLDERCRHHLSR
jgi:hypothetical protein